MPRNWAWLYSIKTEVTTTGYNNKKQSTTTSSSSSSSFLEGVKGMERVMGWVELMVMVSLSVVRWVVEGVEEDTLCLCEALGQIPGSCRTDTSSSLVAVQGVLVLGACCLGGVSSLDISCSGGGAFSPRNRSRPSQLHGQVFPRRKQGGAMT